MVVDMEQLAYNAGYNCAHGAAATKVVAAPAVVLTAQAFLISLLPFCNQDLHSLKSFSSSSLIPVSYLIIPTTITMRFSLLALGAFCAVASAQDLSDIPSCALSCFAAAAPASGCSLTDQKCQCTTGKSAIEDSLMKCVPGKCSADEIASTSPWPSTLRFQSDDANR